MRIFRKYLLLCFLIVLLDGNAAEKFSFDEDVFSQDTDLSQEDDDSTDYRLPTSVKPISYNIHLEQISWDDLFKFNGIVNIQAEITKATNNITLHVGNLEIETSTVSVKGSTIDSNKTYDKITEKYVFFLPEALKEGTVVEIAFKYVGILSDNMIGFYRSSYVDENGQIKWLAATQFQTTHARHAFPCFDEPGFKATFKVSISRPNNYASLSNMPQLTDSGSLLDTDVVDTYEESIPMSTYLVAFVISEFRSLGDTKFKVWARPAAIDQAHYALKIGIAALELFEDLFQQKYSLSKMDMVAVPDFSAGAMENWGLVTYREARMLYDEKESSAPAQQSVASVIVHEITHMWFGNLVTPEWWGYLWLSEAFARFFQYFGTAQIEVDWNMKEQFLVEQHQVVLVTDSFESSRPMTREALSQSEIGTMGDSITYAKGASVVRMMGLTFGIDLFKLALRDYLQNNKKTGLGNPDALWKAIQDQIDNQNSTLKAPVRTIMDTWTSQAGYPVVSVTIYKDMVHVTQERFLLRNLPLNETSTNVTWWIPLSWTTQSSPNFDNTNAKYWLSTKQDNINLKVDPKDWVIFNIQSSGFYRVKYDSDGWQRIFRILNSNRFDEIHVLNRANIVDDLLNLGRAGYENYQTVLSGLTYLKRETNYLPFKAALNGLDYLNRRFAGMEENSLLKEYILSLIDGRRKELGYEDHADDDRLTVLLRREVNNWACNLGDEKCITTYVNKFQKWKTDSIPIKPNERSTAYCVAIRHGTSEDWEFLWKKYFGSNHAADQMVMLSALGCSLNTTILEKYLLYAISSYETTRIRRQDSTSAFSAVYGSGLIGAEYILDFVEKHYQDMEKYYKGQDTIATILNGASQRFSTSRLVTKFENFIKKHEKKLAPIVKSLKSSLKTAQYELKWYQSVSDSIIRWLRDGSKYRLPTNIVPRKYFVSVEPHLEIDNFTFDGNVKIEADVVEETKQIVLHSAEIKHLAVTVMANDMNVKIVNKTEEKQYNFYVIDVSENLPVGTRLTIEIAYTGHLNASELRGFYKSSYMNERKEKRWLAATHLEPVGARKMFPCFDEPGMKAIFTVQVNVPPGYRPISNTNWNKLEKVKDNHMLYTFYETVEMSTYLVALVVSDFEFNSAGQINEADLGVYARHNAINQTGYAATVMLPLVDFFEKAFKQKYQMRKLDMIALPDFPSGAGENWGLITYRETNLLYDGNDSPFTSLQTIRNVIAHELSHQWFGNLVTLSWWKYLWLNEGFARYFEYYAPAHVFEDATLDAQFAVDQVQSALRADASKSTHALSHDVYTPSEIRSRFSTVTYAKGGSILRMIEKTYGTTVFYETLSDYLKEREFNVATPEDLYKALQVQVMKAGLQDNVKDILDTWTTQPGYPIIHVSVKEDVVTLRQERFYLEKQEEDLLDTVWHIPITWASIDNPSEYLKTAPSLWMMTKEATFQSKNLFTLNNQQSGYYRVNYDEQHWSKLIDRLTNGNFNDIHEINRAALIDDLMNFARADYISYATVISATMYLKQEHNYLPWRAFYNNLPYLSSRFRGRGIEDLYKMYLTSIIEPLYERLGFMDRTHDNDLTKTLRMHTRKWACELDIGDCENQATRYFLNEHAKTIPPNYRSVVYCTAMRTDTTENTYNILWEKYLNSKVAADKVIILSSLACSQNKNILEKLLREAITEDANIRYQDSAKVFSDVYDASLNGTEVVMSVIGEYYDDMRRYFDNDYAKIENIMSSLASRLSTYNLYKQYQDLLTQLIKKEPAFDKSARSFMAKAENEFNWYDRNVPVIFEELDKTFSSNMYRLPDTLYPEYYNVHLIPSIEEGTFEGEIQIFMKVKKETTAIVLNADIQNFISIKVYRNYETGKDNPDAEEIPIQNTMKYNALQQLRIYLTEPVNTNYLMAQIKFDSILSDDMKGFYRSSYEDSDGKRHWLATTQFEPAYARRAFPCLDEPAFKSKFIINIKRLNHYNTLSNMPLHKNNFREDGTNYTWDRFKTNEIAMSPYLVAFVVSEFEPINEVTNETFLNVWGRPEIAMHGQFAQETGQLLIDELGNFTEIKYALPKLDLVGVPDFDMGAMENWGLAIFREYGLFDDKNEMSASQEKYIITIIAHELAHMWFGNLVTCEWWEYIWLNEGFAQYFEWFASNMIQPSYNFMDQFVVYELHPALLKDASASAHPMTNPVETPEEINSIFDYVAYGKSSSVLRMIFNAFEPEVHVSAIRSYLAMQNKTGIARPEDLWRSFNLHASIEIDYKNVSFAEVMDTWTNQPGYPVVNAVLRDFRLTLTQKRFLMNEWIELEEHRNVYKEFYWIPYDIIVSLEPYRINTQLKGWLGSEAKDVFINPTNQWFIVNRQQTGFYRVNYDIDSWKRLIDTLNSNRFESIHVLNRAQIIDDLFNLARATHVEYDLLMNATSYLTRERSHLPWKAFFNGLSYIYDRLEQGDLEDYLRRYVLSLMSTIYDKVGFDDRETDEHLDKLNREMILQWACKLRKTECMKKSKELFAAWRKDTSKRVTPNARVAVYCTAIREGTADDWEFLWQQYLETNFAAEKKIIVNALGCSTNKTALRNYLKTAVEEYNNANATFRKQDVAAVFSSVYSASQLGANVALDFLIDNVLKIHASFGNWDKIVSFLHNVASHISNPDQYDKLHKFIEIYIKLNFPDVETKLAPAITTAKINLMWYNRNRGIIYQWILDQENHETIKPTVKPTDDGSTMIEPLNACLMAIVIITSYLLN